MENEFEMKKPYSKQLKIEKNKKTKQFKNSKLNR